MHVSHSAVKEVHRAAKQLFAAVGLTSLVALASPAAAQTECPKTGVQALTGAGSTFVFPLFSKMFNEYGKLCGISVNYQSIGSGGGIRQVQEMTVDFGATDGPMTDQQKAQAKGGEVIHVPVAAGSEAVVYNLPGIPSGTMKLTPDVVADIYLKKIDKWNDPRIASLNPDIKLPDLDIAVVHRSDGSGTTFIWTNYLSKVSKEWADKVGFATSVNWPGDIGGAGNEGVANQVKQVPGGIGYVELAYAMQNKMPRAQIRNKAGKWVEPSLERTSVAADLPDLPDHMQVMFTDSANPEAYPIAGFVWMLVYENQADAAKGTTVAQLAWWMLHDGQKYNAPLLYAPIQGAALKKSEALLQKIKVNGKPALAMN
ncbi:MAG TPA: phosphate ABC transporter substrate-binding protein PstS [Stellaceae bacterium]|nr:phosphate ABC transporter substrate-binding protein PstS [Stellaceae bacterium]